MKSRCELAAVSLCEADFYINIYKGYSRAFRLDAFVSLLRREDSGSMSPNKHLFIVAKNEGVCNVH
jgi:hypothetical protein